MARRAVASATASADSVVFSALTLTTRMSLSSVDLTSISTTSVLFFPLSLLPSMLGDDRERALFSAVNSMGNGTWVPREASCAVLGKRMKIRVKEA